MVHKYLVRHQIPLEHEKSRDNLESISTDENFGENLEQAIATLASHSVMSYFKQHGGGATEGGMLDAEEIGIDKAMVSEVLTNHYVNVSTGANSTDGPKSGTRGQNLQGANSNDGAASGSKLRENDKSFNSYVNVDISVTTADECLELIGIEDIQYLKSKQSLQGENSKERVATSSGATGNETEHDIKNNIAIAFKSHTKRRNMDPESMAMAGSTVEKPYDYATVVKAHDYDVIRDSDNTKASAEASTLPNEPRRLSDKIGPHGVVRCVLFKRIQIEAELTERRHERIVTQLTDKFYSKFHKKRMEDLNDIGLQNFISLFLTLASCVKTDDVIQKLCSFLNLVQNKGKSQSKSSTLVKGLYAVLHLQKKLQIVTSALTEKLKSDFQEICRDFAERHSDPTTRRSYWQLISLHLDSIEELVSGVGCIESEAGFFHVGESLSMIFSNCNDSEARRIASFVYRLLSSVRPKKNSNGSTDVENFLWSGLYPWIQKSFTDKQLIQRIPESIADPAAGFTLLSISSSGTNPSFKEMVLKFSGVDLPVRFVAKYICHLLSSSAAVDKIFQDDCQAIIIRSWFRCLVGLTEKHPLSLELTRLIAQLHEVGKLVENEIRANNQSSENIIFSFIVAFGRQQATANQLSEIAKLRKKASSYFGEILKNTESIISTGNPPDSLRILYSVVGKLVKHCSKLIYSKTSPDCLLPKILDQMVLPRQSTKKVIPAAVTNCLVGHIHQFLSGLSSLDFKKDEFVRRKIKEIFSRYFLTITKRCHALPSSRNPFLVALQNTCIQDPTALASDFRQFVIEIIAENFLVLPQAPENHSVVLYFVLRLYQSSVGHKEITRNSPAIMIQVMCSLISCDACGGTNAEPPGIRKPAMEILTSITKAYKNATSEETLKLQEQLQNVLLLNIQQFQGIVFKSFEALARLDRELAKDLIATARESVEENERSRGCGEDKRLRSALESFIASTGRKLSTF